MTTAGTRGYGVIGWPIGHSLSPAMHSAAFAHLGLDCTYLAFAVAPAQLEAAITGAAALGLAGLNITVPHKEAVLALCSPDAQARAVGAVNTLCISGDGILGYNTDVHGFTELIAEESIDATGRVVVLGAGGAARAVAAALLASARSLVLLARTPRAVVVDGVTLEVRPWQTEALRQADLLVDATPRGLDATLPPLDLTQLAEHAQVVDLAVRKSTALVDAARARGHRACTGALMLLHQGARAFTLFTGRPAPLDVMRRALFDTL